MTTNIEFLHEVVNRAAYQQIVDDLIAVKATFQGDPLFVQVDAAVSVMQRLKAAVTLPVEFTPPPAAIAPPIVLGAPTSAGQSEAPAGQGEAPTD